jgi:hypothetical protein
MLDVQIFGKIASYLDYATILARCRSSKYRYPICFFKLYRVIKMYELLGKEAPTALALRSSSAPAERRFNPHIDRIINQDIDLPESLVDDDQTHTAESLHNKFFTNSEQRTAKLKQLYSELLEPDDLIVMICCKKFCFF